MDMAGSFGNRAGSKALASWALDYWIGPAKGLSLSVATALPHLRHPLRACAFWPQTAGAVCRAGLASASLFQAFGRPAGRPVLMAGTAARAARKSASDRAARALMPARSSSLFLAGWAS